LHIAKKKLDPQSGAAYNKYKGLPLLDGGLFYILLQSRTVNRQDLAVSVFSFGFPASQSV
jgi:hypothetical protein